MQSTLAFLFNKGRINETKTLIKMKVGNNYTTGVPPFKQTNCIFKTEQIQIHLICLDKI